MKCKLGVLISGGGSNLEAIIMNQRAFGYNYEVTCIVNVNNSTWSPRLEIAVQNNIAQRHIDKNFYSGKKGYENQIKLFLQAHEIDLVILAGYTFIVGKTLLDAYSGKILNIHPSVLPSFPGLNAQGQALEHGVCVSGATVHFVDSGTNTGKVIMQKAVSVLKTDTVETLSKRILHEEHSLYSRAIQQVILEKN